MAINWTKEIIAIGVGAADRAAQDMDVTAGRTETFKTASDWVRMISGIGGLAVQAFWPRYGDMGEAAALAGAPLLTQTVWRAVAEQQNGGTSRRVTYSPNRAHSPIAMRPRAQRHPAPVVETQFKNVKLWG